VPVLGIKPLWRPCKSQRPWAGPSRLADAGEPGRCCFNAPSRCNLATDSAANPTKSAADRALQRIEVDQLGWPGYELPSRTRACRFGCLTISRETPCWKPGHGMSPTPPSGLMRTSTGEEWQKWCCQWAAASRDDYLMARRVRRGTRLTRQNRAPDLASVSMPCGEFRPAPGCGSPEGGQTGRGVTVVQRRPKAPLSPQWCG